MKIEITSRIIYGLPQLSSCLVGLRMQPPLRCGWRVGWGSNVSSWAYLRGRAVSNDSISVACLPPPNICTKHPNYCRGFCYCFSMSLIYLPNTSKPSKKASVKLSVYIPSEKYSISHVCLEFRSKSTLSGEGARNSHPCRRIFLLSC